MREQQSVPDRAAGIRRPRPEGGVPAGREDDGRPAQRREGRDALALDHPNPGMLACACRQDVGDMTSRVRTARMHDAGARMAAFPAKFFVEPHTEPAQLFDPPGSVRCQQPDRARPAEAAARVARVGRVERGIVVSTDGRGDASLGGIAVGASVRGLREHEHRGAGVGRCEGSGEAGDPGSDDENVASLAFLPHNR